MELKNPRQRVVEAGKQVGSYFFVETMWSSALSKDDLSLVRKFLTGNGAAEVDAALVCAPDAQDKKTQWSRHYDTDGNCVVHGYDAPIPAKAVFLKLTFGYPTCDQADAQHPERIAIATAIRLVFGVPAAREFILEARYSGDDLEGERISDIGYASMFDTQNINRYTHPPIESAKLRAVPTEAAILLDKAFSQRFPQERFILMWSAFEAAANTLPDPGSNGEKRQRYFKNELGSDVANNEIYRIFQVRNDAFKEGRFANLNFEQECWSLYAAIQLVLMEDCPQRHAFLKGYEQAILDSRA